MKLRCQTNTDSVRGTVTVRGVSHAMIEVLVVSFIKLRTKASSAQPDALYDDVPAMIR